MGGGSSGEGEKHQDLRKLQGAEPSSVSFVPHGV